MKTINVAVLPWWWASVIVLFLTMFIQKMKLEVDKIKSDQAFEDKYHSYLHKTIKCPADDVTLNLQRPLWVKNKLRFHKVPSFLMTDVLMIFDFFRMFRLVPKRMMDKCISFSFTLMTDVLVSRCMQ